MKQTLRGQEFFIEVGDDAICVYLVSDGYIDEEPIVVHMWEHAPAYTVNEMLNHFGDSIEVVYDQDLDALAYIEKAIRSRGGKITQTLDIRTPHLSAV